MTTGQLLLVVGAVFSAALIQAVAGFGFGLLSVPIMVLSVDPKVAVVISSFLGCIVTLWQAVRMREARDNAIVKRMIIPAYLGMPIGIGVFSVVSADTLRLILGCSVIGAVGLLVLPLRLPAGRALDIGAGFVSGVLNTSLSTNGPPLVFALQARKLEPDAFRSTIMTTFALSNVVSLPLFVAFGKVTADGVRGAAIALPALAAGQLMGVPLRRHVHGERFRWLVLGLLLLAALSAIVASL